MASMVISVMAVGNSNVGKSSLLRTFSEGLVLEDQQDKHYAPKTFVTLKVKNMDLVLHLSSKSDAEANEILSDFITYQCIDVVLLCFSTDDPNSLESIEKWHSVIRHYRPTAPVILVGTKIDLRLDRKLAEDELDHPQQVSMDTGVALAEKIGASAYKECSALLGIGVQEVYMAAVLAYLKATQT